MKKSKTEKALQRAEYIAEGKRRMKIRKQRRLDKYSNPPCYSSRAKKGFTCEMGYEDCERRGWCNGDC